MSLFRKNQSGFSLFELMVVVAILSVTASVLVPKYLKEQIRKRQEECRQNLTSLYQAEKKYYELHNEFTSDLVRLGWQAQGSGIYQYRFLPPPPPKVGFLFECSGNIDKDSTIDQSTIDETGQIKTVIDDKAR